jgi:hypothetical protein
MLANKENNNSVEANVVFAEENLQMNQMNSKK